MKDSESAVIGVDMGGNGSQTVTQYTNKFRWQVFFTFCRQTHFADAIFTSWPFIKINIQPFRHKALSMQSSQFG